MTNVLIVDDEKIEREGLKYLLSREEGERTVFEAANGKQALQVLRSEDIQLLLTDIKMPHMTGLELSKKAARSKRKTSFNSIFSRAISTPAKKRSCKKPANSLIWTSGTAGTARS